MEVDDRLELFFSQSLDGFFFMMLDEPVRWDNSLDKDKVLDYVFEHQRITKVNDAMLAQYGTTREQFLGLTPRDLPFSRSKRSSANTSCERSKRRAACLPARKVPLAFWA
jgi:hypothetical protein